VTGFDPEASFATGRKAGGPFIVCSRQVPWHKLAIRR
jgi:hypothetical protein